MHFTHKAGIGLALLTVTSLTAHPAAAQINGFNNGVGFTTNTSNAPGLPAISGGTATLTDDNGYEATSLFYNTAQNINKFTADFTYQASGNRAGDGFAFILQNDPRGTAALGQYGGYLGYGGSGSITPSAAVDFNLYAPYGQGTSFETGGNTGEAGGSGYLATTPVDLSSGDAIHVNLTYDGTTLKETLSDPTANTTFSTSYVTNLATDVGGPTALVGFTAGNGSATAIQTVSDFHYTNSAPVPEASTTISFGLLLGLGLSGLVISARRRKAPSAE